MQQTGWIGSGDLAELEAGREAREILAAVTAEDLRDQVAERRLEAERAARVAERQDQAEISAFLGRSSLAPGEMPTAALADPIDFGHRERVRRAREVLRAEGLADLLPTAVGGGIFDANCGFMPSRATRAPLSRAEVADRAVQRSDARARAERESVGLESVRRVA